jgi:hypothetical protein
MGSGMGQLTSTTLIMKIHVLASTGRLYRLEVEPSDTMESVHKLLAWKAFVPVDQMQLVFDGQRLQDGHTLSECGIVDGDTLDLWQPQLGMISTFSTEAPDTEMDRQLIQYLMAAPGSHPQPPLAALNAMVEVEHANPHLGFVYRADAGLFNAEQYALLCAFADHLFESLASNPVETDHGSEVQQVQQVAGTDMRAVVPWPALRVLLRLVAVPPGSVYDEVEQVEARLRALHPPASQPGREPKVALRVTQGPTPGCINFHCDGEYATCTSQVVLSDDAEQTGGHLVFFTQGALHMPERRVGSLTQHSPQVLHAVTALHGSGRRRSLFVLDKSNGLGEDGVLHVTQSHVAAFALGRPRSAASVAVSAVPPAARCVLCTAAFPTLACVPCGHVYLCVACGEETPTMCAVCQRSVVRTMRLLYA